MKTILFTAILIIGLLGVGELTITFKSFSVSLPCWYKAVGILLFWLSMTIYVSGEHIKNYGEGFDAGVKKCIEILENKKIRKENL